MCAYCLQPLYLVRTILFYIKYIQIIYVYLGIYSLYISDFWVVFNYCPLTACRHCTYCALSSSAHLFITKLKHCLVSGTTYLTAFKWGLYPLPPFLFFSFLSSSSVSLFFAQIAQLAFCFCFLLHYKFHNFICINKVSIESERGGKGTEDSQWGSSWSCAL